MKYIVHLKYPLMYWDKDHLATVKRLHFPREPHIITQDGERYVELPKTKFKIGEDSTRGLNYFAPITYYSLDDTPDVDIKQTVTEEK